MRPRAGQFLAVLAIAVSVVGLALTLVTMPWLTSTLVGRVGSAELAGLDPSQTRSLAEEVRHFVTSPQPPALPREAYGRPAFDERQVSHLDDVRAVIVRARAATWTAVAFAGAWMVWQLRKRRHGVVARVLRGGAIVAIAAVVLAALLGLLDFDALFVSFHGVFFEPGTWMFYYDDLLIQLFPERFWMEAAGLWALSVLAGGTLLLAAAAALAGRAGDPAAE